jgi:hypothetical protein
VHAHQVSSAGGRWVSTFATDIEPGDKIRRDGDERIVVGRDYPPVPYSMRNDTGRLTAAAQITPARSYTLGDAPPEGSSRAHSKSRTRRNARGCA